MNVLPRFRVASNGTVSVVVLPVEDGLRIDQFLAAATELSRRAARTVIADGGLLRNEKSSRNQSRPVNMGDVIQILRPAAELGIDDTPVIPQPAILYEDKWLVAADKPPGVLSQPAERSTPADLSFDRILLLYLSLRDGRRRFLRMVHRLDRATSGVVLFARNNQALPPLTGAWSSGAVDRRYLAVVEGHPETDDIEIDRPIERDYDHEWRFRTGPEGKSAKTTARVVERRAGDIAVLECRLETGRTHQVRVHLAAVGHPVIGDLLYGATMRDDVRRPMLHAWSLRLPHPKDRKPVDITSPIPADMESFLRRSR